MGPLCPITYYKKWNLLSTHNESKYQIPSYLSSRLIEIDYFEYFELQIKVD